MPFEPDSTLHANRPGRLPCRVGPFPGKHAHYARSCRPVSRCRGSTCTTDFPCNPVYIKYKLPNAGVRPFIIPTASFRLLACPVYQSVTQYNGDDTMITTALGDPTTAEDFVYNFFGGEYKYSNRW